MLRLLLAFALTLASLPGCGRSPEPQSDLALVARPAQLPPEALATLALIQRGGPFPYRKDGTHFQNREGRLPARPRGHYREYTVPTPGSPDRGARRIIAGGDPPREFYYSADHYRSFRPIEVRPGAPARAPGAGALPPPEQTLPSHRRIIE
jgi:ribonuclease T1